MHEGVKMHEIYIRIFSPTGLFLARALDYFTTSNQVRFQISCAQLFAEQWASAFEIALCAIIFLGRPRLYFPRSTADIRGSIKLWRI